MIQSVIFTIGSLFFSTLLLVIYFYQKRVSNTKNQLYRLLIITNVITCIIEILSILFLEKDITVGTIFIKIKFMFLIIFGMVNYFYTLVFINKNLDMTYKELFGKITFKLLLVIELLGIIAFFVLPGTNYINDGNLVYFSGYSMYLYIGLVISMVAVLLVQCLVKFKELNKNDKTYIFVILFIQIVICAVQVVSVDVAILPLGHTILLFAMYNIIENPDLYTIELLEKNKNNTAKYKGVKIGFLSNMSDDIKTPLKDIHNSINKTLALDAADSATLRANVKKLYNSSNELLSIINNILAISTIDNGTQDVSVKEYNPKDLVNELSEIIRPRLEEKNIEFEVVVPDKLPAKVKGDTEKIKQVLTNILNNAVEFTKLGKVRFVLDCDIVDIRAVLTFKVEDSGTGMTPDVQAKVFTNDQNEEKQGIGLVVCKEYVELMGGKIWFESKPLLGTTFHVQLPQDIVAEDNAPLYSDLTGKRVLVVDDNRLNLTVAKKLLELHNLTVVTATTGEECLNIINGTTQFDLIFLDHSMPGMDGVETFKKIKTLNVMTKIPPIIAFTANAIEGMKETYEQEGFDDYLSKPIQKEDLDRILSTYLK